MKIVHLRKFATAIVIGALWASSSSAWAQQVLLSDDFQAAAINATNFPTVQKGQTQTGVGNGFPTRSLWFDGTGAGDGTLGAAARLVLTKSLDTSGGSGTIKFDLRYTAVGQTDPGSFGVMEGGEDITLAYTTNGSTFTTIQTFLATDATYSAGFVTVTIALPVGAISTTTQIRWSQVNFNDGDDNWAIDNVSITAVPEPGTWALYGLGATGLLAAVRRRRAAAKSAATTTTKA